MGPHRDRHRVIHGSCRPLLTVDNGGTGRFIVVDLCDHFCPPSDQPVNVRLHGFPVDEPHGERSCKEKQDKRYDQEHHKLRLYGKPKYRSKEREYGPTRKPDRRERHGRRLDSDQNYKGHKPSDHIHKITPLRAPLSCRLKHQDRCCDGGI